MSKTETVRARIEPELKIKAEKILARLGLNPSRAIDLFFHQIVLKNGIPFELKIPNEETAKAIEGSRKGVNLKKHKNPKELFEDLNS